MKTFQDDLIELCEKAHGMARSKGFYDTPKTLTENIVLIAGEVGEMVEAHRKGDAESAKIPGITESEEEAADVIIRIMDTVGYVMMQDWAKLEHGDSGHVGRDLLAYYLKAEEEDDVLASDAGMTGWGAVTGLAKACYWSIIRTIDIVEIIDHTALAPIHIYLADLDYVNRGDLQMGLCRHLGNTIAAIEGHYPNVRLVVEAKMQYNQGRPRLHGKKY